MSADRPLICIGAPVYGDVGPDVLEDWMRFAYHCGRRLPQYDFCTAIVPKKEQFRARNAIVDAAQQANADWLLMLDDDMIVNPFITSGPTADYGLIERLIAHHKDICGALYYQRSGACAPVLMRQVGDGHGYRFLRDDELTGGLQRVDVAGGGCLLIRMPLFDKLKYPYFGPEFEYGTDIQLCRAATAKGFEVWADTSVELGHVREERTTVTRVNRRQFQLTDPVQGEIKKQFVTADVYNRLTADAAEWTGFLDVEAMTRVAHNFMQERAAWTGTDAEWYRQFPKERVARQVWFNTQHETKRRMTEFILGAIDSHRSLEILDFGCGIGIPAFSLAEKGHRVTACDLLGTGTLEFLKWRATRHGVELTIHESHGGVPPLGDAQFDVIIAMDTLEHIPEWRDLVRDFGRRLKPHGVFFSNNAVLEDNIHPEHYPLDNKEFVEVCMQADLMPFNEITFTKRAPSASAPGAAESEQLAHA